MCVGVEEKAIENKLSLDGELAEELSGSENSWGQTDA